MPLKPLAAPAGLLLAEADGLLVIVTLRSPDNLVYNAIMDAQEAAVARHRTLTLLSVLPVFDGPLKADAQTQRTRGAAFALLSSSVLGHVSAITVSGIQGTMLRAVMTGIQLVGRSPFNKITSTVPEAVTWAQKLPNQRPTLAFDAFLARDIQNLVSQGLASSSAAPPRPER